MLCLSGFDMLHDVIIGRCHDRSESQKYPIVPSTHSVLMTSSSSLYKHKPKSETYSAK